MSRATKLAHVPRETIAAYIASGLSDPRIAKLYGVTTPAVWYYRKKHKLPTSHAPRLARVKRDVVEWLIDRGLSDAEIGRIFRVSSAAVCAYRENHAIPALRPRRGGWAA